MTVQEAIASRLAAIEAEHLDGTPPAPTPAPLTVAGFRLLLHATQVVCDV